MIKLQFCIMIDDVLNALKQLTGFKSLTFKVDVPNVKRCWQSEGLTPRVSPLLAHMKDNLTPALGPGIYAKRDGYQVLVFTIQDHKQ